MIHKYYLPILLILFHSFLSGMGKTLEYQPSLKSDALDNENNPHSFITASKGLQKTSSVPLTPRQKKNKKRREELQGLRKQVPFLSSAQAKLIQDNEVLTQNNTNLNNTINQQKEEMDNLYLLLQQEKQNLKYAIEEFKKDLEREATLSNIREQEQKKVPATVEELTRTNETLTVQLNKKQAPTRETKNSIGQFLHKHIIALNNALLRPLKHCENPDSLITVGASALFLGYSLFYNRNYYSGLSFLNQPKERPTPYELIRHLLTYCSSGVTDIDLHYNRTRKETALKLGYRLLQDTALIPGLFPLIYMPVSLWKDLQRSPAERKIREKKGEVHNPWGVWSYFFLSIFAIGTDRSELPTTPGHNTYIICHKK